MPRGHQNEQGSFCNLNSIMIIVLEEKSRGWYSGMDHPPGHGVTKISRGHHPGIMKVHRLRSKEHGNLARSFQDLQTNSILEPDCQQG